MTDFSPDGAAILDALREEGAEFVVTVSQSLPSSDGMQVIGVGVDTLHVTVMAVTLEGEEIMGCLFRKVESLSKEGDVSLFDGYVVSFDGDSYYLLKGGVRRYAYSLWVGDSRIFLSRNYARQGFWFQAGPQFINQYCDSLREGVLEFLRGLGLSGSDFSLRVIRLDLAVDVEGAKVPGFDTWTTSWVSRAKWSGNIYYNPDSLADVDTTYVGSSDSPIRLRVYNKLKEAESVQTLGFWLAIWSARSGLPSSDILSSSVTRYEFQVRLKDGAFEGEQGDCWGLSDLDDQARLSGLGDYLTRWWGRLVAPSGDSNLFRRPVAPVWQLVGAAFRCFSRSPVPVVRLYGSDCELNLPYLRGLAGYLSGAVARLSYLSGAGQLASVSDVVSEMKRFDLFVNEKASAKFQKLCVDGVNHGE